VHLRATFPHVAPARRAHIVSDDARAGDQRMRVRGNELIRNHVAVP
jgi:hypothetical protein